VLPRTAPAIASSGIAGRIANKLANSKLRVYLW